MIFNKSIRRLIGSLESSGYGKEVIGGKDESNSAFYMVDLGGVILRITSDKFSVEREGVVELFCFSDVVGVVSYLNAEVCSNASANRDSNFSLPLEVRLKSGYIRFSVPFLAYSRLLNIFSELRGGN
jgi:hypothetical protein